MATRTNFLWLFIYILFLHAVAVFFFSRGFLLTRTELSAFSECSDIAEAPCSHNNSVRHGEEAQNKQTCWTKPAVDRVVLLVLDALRFDFVAPSSFFKEVKPWMNKLQVLQKLASEEGSSARIFKAIADPPTTSLQRLKGLTTGGLPTFIDVGNSFGAPAITEDNLIYQLIKNGRRVVMMGDDTWLQLFPNHFQEAYPFPSFNVKDLHTVDDGVIEHLFPALYRNDWDILIAHFLGVDHAGHIFGVDSTPMIEKLEQYNGVLEEVVSILKNHSEPRGLHENTLLIVMGDHGQTLNGDHGGGTPEEVETSIFAMSMHNPAGLTPSTLDTSVCKPALDGKNNICIGSIPQLDFAVTLAALVGIPFPFGSVGRVNPELYSLSAGTWHSSGSILDDESIDCLKVQSWMEQYADVLCINSWQAFAVSNMLKDTARVLFPRLVYILTTGLASLLFYERKAKWKGGSSNFKESLAVAAVTILSTWSSTILLLLGKQGPFIALLALLQGWCLLKLQKLDKGKEGINAQTNEIESDPLLVIQWSLLAVQLFFCTGHRCTFDGLRYGAAFVGFDNFNIIRQGVLLAIDTFGVSHILPIFGLPLMVTTQHSNFQNDKHQQLLFLQLMQVFLIYGLASAFTATLTTICVTIQRRHLMVWGLFAPKYVFDILGLLLGDGLIILAFIYYF